MVTACPADAAAGPEQILQLATAQVAARALQVIAEAGIADVLDDSPRTADELAADTALNADALDRLLTIVEPHGLFRRDADGWHHTDGSRLLRTHHPTSMRDFARLMGLPVVWQSLAALDFTARTGETAATTLDAAGFFGYLASHPDEHATFQAAMTSKAHGDIPAVLDAYDFAGIHTLADIGGGRGHLLAAILAKHAGISGVLFDLSHVVAEVEPGAPFDSVAGDFFNDPLPAADAYLLMDIIHDWADKEAAAILRAIAEAGRATNARVLLLESVLPDGPEPHWAKTLDGIMLAVTGGRQRTLAQYRALFDDAGIDFIDETTTRGPFSIVEGRVRTR